VNVHTFTRDEKAQTNVVCHKADGNCSLGWERSAAGGIHATRGHDNIRSMLRNTKKLHRVIENKRHGMLISGVLVLLLHDNAHLHTATRI
jgi:hypothetical protein